MSGLPRALVCLAVVAGCTAQPWNLAEEPDAGAPTCTADNLEEDDSQPTATALGSLPATRGGLTACPGDVDWFGFAGNGGVEVVIARVDHPLGGGIVGLDLRSPGGSLRSTHVTTATASERHVPVPGSGSVPIWLEVALSSDTGDPGLDYSLEVSTIPYQACADDALEPNDHRESPRPMPLGTKTQLRTCPESGDYLTLAAAVEPMGRFSLAVTWLPGDGDLSVEMLDSSGRRDPGVVQADQDAGEVRTRTFAREVPAGSASYLPLLSVYQERGWAVPGGIPYSVTPTVTTPPACLPDGLADGSDAASAHPLGTLPATLSGLTLCSSTEEDWFEIMASGGHDLVNLRLDHPGADGELTLHVFDARGGPVEVPGLTWADQAGLRTTELAFPATGQGTVRYRLRVTLRADAGQAGVEYRLRAATRPFAPCVDDSYEPDDQPRDANAVPLGQPLAARACPLDPDVWVLPRALRTWERLEIVRTHDLTEGSIVQHLLPEGGGQVMPQRSERDEGDVRTLRTELLIRPGMEGRYLVEQQLQDAWLKPAGAAYTMTVRAGPGCADDAAEDNDTPQTATPLTLPLDRRDLRVCPDDPADWYALSLRGGSQIRLDVPQANSHAEGEIVVRFTDARGGALGSVWSNMTWPGNENGQRHELTVPGSGPTQVLVEVTLPVDDGDLGTAYRLVGEVVGEPPEPPEPDARYAFVSLGRLDGGQLTQVRAINGLGHAAGLATDGEGRTHAFVHHAEGALRVLDTLGGPTGEAWDLNDDAHVVGVVETEELQRRAVLWDGELLVDLGTLGGPDSIAHGVNAADQVVGYSMTEWNEPHAFSWAGAELLDLGTLGGRMSMAWDVNASGQVVGQATVPSGDFHAFLWEDGRMEDIGGLGGPMAIAYAINDRGEIVGVAELPNLGTTAFWRPAPTEDDPRPAPRTLERLGGFFANAKDVNANGLVVGTSERDDGGALRRVACAWQGGDPVDLNERTELPADVELHEAWGVNARGQIVGVTFVDGGAQVRAWRLDPVE